MNYYSFTDPRGIKGRVGLVWLNHSRQFSHKVVSCHPQIGIRAGKVCRPKTDILTTELRRQKALVDEGWSVDWGLTTLSTQYGYTLVIRLTSVINFFNVTLMGQYNKERKLKIQNRKEKSTTRYNTIKRINQSCPV